MSHFLPEKVLQQHTAVLGKTGSGKTSTAKLIVEHVVEEAKARVCILDPIKSDWWGLTSNASGKGPGLPFAILGGPRKHVPLHSGAGAAIAELVADGRLPLSILDMADFEPGGLQKFFTEFAPALIRKMRGVLYLVIEEAHEFAPKERAGFGSENLAIHWAKKLATAGRSKGIRLIIATQRTQSLHNALLGSCETLIAHRTTAPADQEPILKWLAGNLSKERVKEVAASLPQLVTGEAWVCSGEAQLFERRKFPRISTYDNTATPTGDLAEIEVKTAPVDHDRLKSIIGEAAAEAEANDPAVLKAEIRRLSIALAASQRVIQPPAVARVEVPIIDGPTAVLLRDGVGQVGRLRDDVATMLRGADKAWEDFNRVCGLLYDRAKTQTAINSPAAIRNEVGESATNFHRPHRAGHVEKMEPVVGTAISGATRRVMIAIAQRPGLNARQIGVRSGVKQSGSTYRAAMATLRKNGWLSEAGGGFSLNRLGMQALGDYDPLPAGPELVNHYLGELSPGAGAMLNFLVKHHPDAIAFDELAAVGGTHAGASTFRAYMAKLRALELIEDVDRGTAKASDEFFQ